MNKEFLKIDFPKIPKPKNTEEFLQISGLGYELLKLHLWKVDNTGIYPFIGTDRRISKVALKDNRLYINKTSYFDQVLESDWLFAVGSYLPTDLLFTTRTVVRGLA